MKTTMVLKKSSKNRIMKTPRERKNFLLKRVQGTAAHIVKTRATMHILELRLIKQQKSLSVFLEKYPMNPEEGNPSEGVGIPSEGVGIPSEGVGIPSEGVGIPSEGVGIPSEGVGIPSEGVGIPSEGVGIPFEG
jgi:hypothetical protein